MEVTEDLAKYVITLQAVKASVKERVPGLNLEDVRWRDALEGEFPALVRIREDAAFELWLESKLYEDVRVKNMLDTLGNLAMLKPNSELENTVRQRLQDARNEAHADLLKDKVRLRREWRRLQAKEQKQ